MTIQAIHNHIIFRFEDAVNTKGEFEEAAHKSGIVIKGGYDKSAKSPRWATVLNAGAECEHVKTGDRILIPALRWTEGVKYQEQRYWKTDEEQIVGYQRDGQQLVLLNKHVVFTPIKETITASSSGLLVVQHTSGDTPSGRVKMIAADSCSELENSTIYYDNANFFNAFELDQAEYSFIKEDDIIVYATEE